jgi:hypothetical protein
LFVFFLLVFFLRCLNLPNRSFFVETYTLFDTQFVLRLLTDSFVEVFDVFGKAIDMTVLNIWTASTS